MATALFRTFPCGPGDCIFLLITDDNGNEFHLMVDCGSYNKQIQEFVENTLHKRIDLLIATHIDNDHIAGLSTMLKSTPDLQIGNIIYNCYQQPKESEKTINDSMQTLINEYMQELPSVIEESEYKVSARKAILLAKSIYDNNDWKNVWYTNYITVDSKDFELKSVDGFSFGKLVFLSPTKEALDKLDQKYQKAFLRYFYKRKENNYINEANIFELLTLLQQLEDYDITDSQPTSNSDITNEYLNRIAKIEKEDESEENIASIAFIWEYNDARILFLGDAAPKVVIETIKEKYTGRLPLKLLVTKMSHHGSMYSTSLQLFETIKTRHYIFTGGNQKERPSEATIAKILTSGLDGNEQLHYLHFKYKNPITERYVNAPIKIKTALNFEADYNQIDAFKI